MTARIYDVILTVDNAAGFETTNVVYGNTSQTVGVIADVDVANNTLKVRLANALQEYSNTETIHSNVATISGTANGIITSNSIPLQANTLSGNVTTASATISAIAPSHFIAEKNAFSQNPIVRLYSVYFPGEWYPPNNAGNPTGKGEGRAWPADFPLRFSEFVADTANDLSYNVVHDGIQFLPIPINLSTFDEASDGKINELTVTMYNLDNIITRLVEDPYLVGNNISNSVVAVVNGEEVHGIDPRTVNATPAQVGTVGEEAFDSLTRARANGLAYDATVVAAYGTANASFTKTQTEIVNGTWRPDKEDTRDMLGGVVEIKTTFANFLDFYPEYSQIQNLNGTGNVLTMENLAGYRIGDVVTSPDATLEATIYDITADGVLYLDGPLDNVSSGSAVYIKNEEADPESVLIDKFKIDQLESLSDQVASFGLVSWLQYFKITTPKRKYYKNTCQWVYKGEECQYPGPGGLPIPGEPIKTSNVNPIAANNEIAASEAEDVCSKSFKACELRGNEIHFGGFPGTGRTIPRA